MQFGDRFGRGRLNKVVDCRHRILDPVLWKVGKDSVLPRTEGQAVIGNHHPGQVAQDQNGVVHFSLMRHPAGNPGHFRLPKHVGNQCFAKFCGIVLCRGFQSVEERGNRCSAPWLLQGRYCGWLGRLCDTRQPFQLHSRNSVGRRRTQSERSKCIQTVQVFRKLGGWRFSGLARNISSPPRLSASFANRPAICARCASFRPDTRRCHKRSRARSLMRPTRRSRVEMPGRITLFSISQSAAHWTRCPGRSSLARQKA